MKYLLLFASLIALASHSYAQSDAQIEVALRKVLAGTGRPSSSLGGPPSAGISSGLLATNNVLALSANGSGNLVVHNPTNAFTTTLSFGTPTASFTMTFPALTASSSFLTSTLTTNNVDVANSIWGVSNGLRLEGATANGFELTLTTADIASSDKTITFPDASGTVLLTEVDQWVFEGVTADGFENTVSTVDPTADGTVTLSDLGVGLADVDTSFVYSTINAGLNAPGLATSVWTGASTIVFEGTTADGFELSIGLTDPTADSTWTIANFAVNAAFVGSTLTTNNVDAANSIWLASNSVLFEGATADAFELTLAPADVAADRTVTIPDAGAASVLMFSTLTTNTFDIANSIWFASNAMVLEGATADAFETTITPADATADSTATVPNVTGTVAISVAATTAALVGDDQAVTPGKNTHIQLTSDDGTATNRTFTLSATGAITGATYTFIGPATNQCEIADGDPAVLSATWSPTTNDTLTLFFNGTNFIEVSRANN